MLQQEPLLNTKILRERQAWPLKKKIIITKRRIIDWYRAFDGNVSISFSGGRDSTVLVHIVRSIYPNVPAVFCNTGLEYPENVSFVKSMSNIEIIRPAVPFHIIIKKWGYPVISKRVAQYIGEVQKANAYNKATVRLRLTGKKTDGRFSSISMIPKRWQFLCNAPFKISDKCCKEMKKRPFEKYVKRTGRYPIIGTMAAESQLREQTYLRYGCNRFDLQMPNSNPLSFWTNKDIIEYIKLYNLSYSKVYDIPEIESTGCMFCLFGIHLEQRDKGTNRFVLMKKYHPKHWKYCVEKLGAGKIMDYINIPYGGSDIYRFLNRK